MTDVAFSPGTLVTARGREWMVLAGSTADTLRVRPISGSEEDQTLIYLPLEPQGVREARFPLPDQRHLGGHDAALLLRDALLLSMRRGAGPFRSFGQISVEPRAYQLVPLLMALKLEPVRLLIADDVGVGKTIEAALILREMLDRGDIERSVVLCPPHLVEQWVTELEGHFNLQAVAVTASSAKRLERAIPPGVSLFQVHPHTVVSLDYIKSQERRANFLHHCPDFVIVDEAHACVGNGQGHHQRYNLLRGLADDADRHLVLLTATPHSGDDTAFYRLLGLLDRSFEGLQAATENKKERERLRERLGSHFVQRRRVDIAEWQESGLFPKRETRELTYKFTGEWEAFFNAVLDYCAEIVAGDENNAAAQRLNFWGTLALLRCAASSPMAAVLALRTRAGEELSPDERGELLDRLFDGDADSLVEDDVEPPAATDDPALTALAAQAEKLAGQAGDPKLKVVSDHVVELLNDKDHAYHPVIFCRYITTAHYLGKHLKRRLPDATVEVITGELPAEEREARVAKLGDVEGHRVLVATDCLSEGINLQDHFDAVIHYDLSWNPTRHEQREGRVDRFGQTSPTVRATLMYGSNNPVDGAVLEVILRKAERIRKELGVPVPIPDEGHSLTQALLKGVLLRRKDAQTPMPTKQLALFEEGWATAEEKAKANRTIFAQRRLRPEDVLPEWNKSLAAIGGRDAVKRFTDRALTRFGAGLEDMRHGFKAPTASLPEEVRERLDAEGLTGTLRIDFRYPAPPPCRAVQRSHPLVAVLAETLLERSLNSVADPNSPSVLGRVGCWVSDAVTKRTTLALLRLRHQLVIRRGRRDSTLLVEEATGLAWAGQSGQLLRGSEVMALLNAPPLADVPPHVREREAAKALALLGERANELEAFAKERANALLDDHLRVRAAAYHDEKAETRARSAQVEALPRPDVIGVFVLLPKVG
ncbi:Superfamily II DNA/RNA helicase, SNF2 family [Myxococcus hansupus]|uniref:Superfamily II DNA/RNA helicase, SNF2 family n=1 Tax=Pseudomyxococcus hansupus TaxID=1297742 RepID=A0A0H4WZH0_9BACT|nr:helicase-related protein [Myxococcus hansupus]AKQ68204.1 Superfamily II DNA/RNA helicase, SNF2 family [Myxococcus hansupus]